ncbi:hypothetical protein KSP39_PZI024061 [Platanthera zijinensis]|uniref:Uncharacterized protein n=1 Tax=Platanthera zijinensis TaxID=2320716 RepID=A0AAP0AU14_9ASPA
MRALILGIKGLEHTSRSLDHFGAEADPRVQCLGLPPPFPFDRPKQLPLSSLGRLPPPFPHSSPKTDSYPFLLTVIGHPPSPPFSSRTKSSVHPLILIPNHRRPLPSQLSRLQHPHSLTIQQIQKNSSYFPHFHLRQSPENVSGHLRWSITTFPFISHHFEFSGDRQKISTATTTTTGSHLRPPPSSTKPATTTITQTTLHYPTILHLLN